MRILTCSVLVFAAMLAWERAAAAAPAETPNHTIVATEREHFDVCWYGVREAQLLLERAGFRDVRLTGDYTDQAATERSGMSCYSATPA